MTDTALVRAIDEAAAACRAAARAIAADAEDRGQVAAWARATWEGPHRRTFDGAVDALDREGSALATEALGLASAFDAVATTAGPERGPVAGGGW